jgi:hypothetical protein
MGDLDQELKAVANGFHLRLTETEIKLSTEVHDLTATVKDVHRMIVARFGRPRSPDDHGT